jgi:hypothetical protein
LHSSFIADLDITKTPSTTAFKPGNTWFIFEGRTRPMLMMRYNRTITDAYQLQLAGTTLDTNYRLANDIDMASAFTNEGNVWATDTNSSTGPGFAPIGNGTTVFAGSFNGQDYEISNLYINRPTTDYVGLFGKSSGIIHSLGLVNPDITGDTVVGGFVGHIVDGKVSEVYVSGGSIAGSSSLSPSGPFGTLTLVGGIAGITSTGTLINSAWNSADIYGAIMVGGIAGDTNGSVRNSYNIGTVTGTPGGNSIGGLVGFAVNDDIVRSYNAGDVIVNGAGTKVGGLIGWLQGGTNQALVRYTYNIGSVTVGANSDDIGGFVGRIAIAGGGTPTIAYSYSSGKVTVGASSTDVGGFVGTYVNGTFTDNFWDAGSSNQSDGVGSGAPTNLTGGCFGNTSCTGGMDK